MAKTELKTASVLAFERKLDPSDALFSAGRWEARKDSAHWPSISVREKSVRGTISNRLKSGDQDAAKLDAKIQNPNLQTVDVATLPNDSDTLRARFTLRVLGGAGTPSACNNADYQQQLLQTVQSYVGQFGFAELAKRYAMNLANGRFLWRNRMGAEQIEVQVNHQVSGQAQNTWTFDALRLPWREFTTSGPQGKAIDELAKVIETGLAGNGYVLLEVVAYARIGDGQEVFPSQELILERGTKSKTLYRVGDIAAMHSQKIGNALRTIDTWYPDAQEFGPIAVEPYGSVTSQGKAWRQPKAGFDFYSLLDNWVLKGKVPAPEQQHFVMATLVRGGVFGDSEKG